MEKFLRVLIVVYVAIFMSLTLTGESRCQCRTNVSTEEARDLINSMPDLIVVDVRYYSEFCGSLKHIPGALNHTWVGGVVEGYEELPTDADLLVVCKSGHRSGPASDWLCSNGFSSIYNMIGGMDAWVAAGYETELWPCCDYVSDCNDNNPCTDDTCIGDGFCQNSNNTAPCDDGLYCTANDSCSGGVCVGTGTPCAACESCDEIGGQCAVCDADDCDCDGITEGEGDNCVEVANGPSLGTCSKNLGGMVVGTGVLCNSDEDCVTGETCDLAQGNCNGSSCGDACECYADITGSGDVADGKVDLSDLVLMKGEFLQSCPPSACRADLNDDNKVDLSDLVIMKAQFLLTGCPACP